MRKYIDAEKLKNALSNRYTKITVPIITDEGCIESYYRRSEIHHIINLIESLQQEQPELPDNLDEAAKEYDEVESWSYEALPYPRRAAFIEGTKWMARQMKQEQIEEYGPYARQYPKSKVGQEYPGVDLEKEIEEHVYSMPHCEFSHYTEDLEDEDWARAEFRYFYELGKKEK